MRIAVIFRRPAQNESAQDKGHRLFLVSRKDENLTARQFTITAHFTQGRTLRERYLPRISLSEKRLLVRAAIRSQ